MSGSPQISVPQPDELDLEFFKATVAAGHLMVQRCADCGTWTHPARYYCPACFGDRLGFERASGRATVYSYTVSHFTVEAAWKPLVPYVTIVAELEEGPRIIAASRGITPETVALGQKLVIEVEVKSPEYAFFWAAPATGAT